MYKVDINGRFDRAYNKLDPKTQEAVDDAIVKLMNGRPYPKGLRVKKMKGHSFVFEASPTMSTRITFHFNNTTYIILRNVGTHDITLSNP